ncbi:MAG: hypothetical protein JXB13_18935 [Phycisphaerae bacterium]|nr:hypothetical protein [Phycisphaerae bacterium]
MDAGRARQIEAEFLAGVEANLKQTRGSGLTTSPRVVRQDDVSVRREQRRTPSGGRLFVHNFERRWWVLRRRSGVTVASVLVPQSAVAEAADREMPPVELGDLADHVRELIVDPEVPHVIGVCSPSGFTDDVYRAGLEIPNVTLVLVSPDAEGRWRVESSSGRIDESTRTLFDPGDTSREADCIRKEIIGRLQAAHPATVSAASVAAQRRLPVEFVTGIFEDAARSDPRLRLERSGSDVRLHGGAPAAHRAADTIGILARVRALFEEDAANAVRLADLTEQRAALTHQRDRVFEDMGRLEHRETELLAEGRAATADSVRRRLAGELAQVRREHGLQSALAGVIGSQVDVLSTHIHHLTLLQQGRQVQLPDADELTRHAADAEQMLEGLWAEAEQATELAVGSDMPATDEEAAILREFEGKPAAEEAPKLPARDRPQTQPPRASHREAELEE